MNEALTIDRMTDQDLRISQAIVREEFRLRKFIRRQVPDASDAEDILQEVFFELVEAVRLLKPIEQIGAWLFRVARNRIIDRFRKRSPAPWRDVSFASPEEREKLREGMRHRWGACGEETPEAKS